MDCIFCKQKNAVAIVKIQDFVEGQWQFCYIVECGSCRAQGQAHHTTEAAEQEWQRLAGYEEALQEFNNFYSLALSQFTDGWESRQSDDRVIWGWNDADLTIGMFRKARAALGEAIRGKVACKVCKRSLPDIGFEDGVCVDCTH